MNKESIANISANTLQLQSNLTERIKSEELKLISIVTTQKTASEKISELRRALLEMKLNGNDFPSGNKTSDSGEKQNIQVPKDQVEAVTSEECCGSSGARNIKLIEPEIIDSRDPINDFKLILLNKSTEELEFATHMMKNLMEPVKVHTDKKNRIADVIRNEKLTDDERMVKIENILI